MNRNTPHLDVTQQDNVAWLWVWKPLFHLHETINLDAYTACVENTTKRVQDRGIQYRQANAPI